MCFYGHQIGLSFAGCSQVALLSTGLIEARSNIEIGAPSAARCDLLPLDKSAYADAHAQNTPTKDVLELARSEAQTFIANPPSQEEQRRAVTYIREHWQPRSQGYQVERSTEGSSERRNYE